MLYKIAVHLYLAALASKFISGGIGPRPDTLGWGLNFDIVLEINLVLGVTYVTLL